MTRPARLVVGVISAGRVGSVLGAALARAGHMVVAASAVSAASVARAERMLPDAALLPPDEVARRADLVLLALPDDALAGTIRGLVATESLRRGQIVVHTSGASGIDVLRPAADIGVLGLALHPVLSFTGRQEDLDRLATCCVGVTAAADDSAAWNVGEALTMEMGAEPIRVPEEARALYHAALAHGANNLITLIADCSQLLGDAGIGNAERLLAPLLSASLDNVLRHGDRALTGPVARGDAGTVRRHLGALADRAPAIVPAYRTLASRTVVRACDAGLLDQSSADDINEVLDKPAKGEGAP